MLIVKIIKKMFNKKKRKSFNILKNVTKTGLKRGHTYKKSNVFINEHQNTKNLSNALIIKAQNKNNVIYVCYKNINLKIINCIGQKCRQCQVKLNIFKIV
jgi:hypothetical protein